MEYSQPADRVMQSSWMKEESDWSVRPKVYFPPLWILMGRGESI